MEEGPEPAVERSALRAIWESLFITAGERRRVEGEGGSAQEKVALRVADTIKQGLKLAAWALLAITLAAATHGIGLLFMAPVVAGIVYANNKKSENAPFGSIARTIFPDFTKMGMELKDLKDLIAPKASLSPSLSAADDVQTSPSSPAADDLQASPSSLDTLSERARKLADKFPSPPSLDKLGERAEAFTPAKIATEIAKKVKEAEIAKNARELKKRVDPRNKKGSLLKLGIKPGGDE